MAFASDLENKRFGRLLVISRYGTGIDGHATWRCVCDCGGEAIANSATLKRGHKNSCGCLHRERMSKFRKTHGMSHTITWNSWMGAKDRCFRKTHVAFNYYGGAGISMCDKWKNSFEAFYADMGERPKGTTLDRIDNSKGYEPGNCRWANQKIQSNNSGWPRFITFRGETKNLSEWAVGLGMNINSVRLRIVKMGWPIERALTELPKPRRKSKSSSPS